MSNQQKHEIVALDRACCIKSLGLSFVAACLIAFPASSQERDSSDSSIERMLSSVLEELNAKQDWIGQADQKIHDLLSALQISDQNVAAAATHIAEIQNSITNLEERLDDQENQVSEVKRKISDLESSITWHVNVAYRLQRKHWLRTFLEQENAQRNDRYVRYHQYFVNSKNKSITDFEQLLGEMREISSSILKDQDLLKDQQNQWTIQKAVYDQQSKVRRTQISELNVEVEQTQQDVAKLLEDRERLESLLVEIERQSVSASNQFERVETGTEPVSGSLPVKGEILIGFGDPRADGRLKWQGVHIAAESGTDIVAVAPGRVVFADWLLGFGMMLILDHGDEVFTVYGYCDTLLVRLGRHVEAGEVVATVGQSGGQMTPGLYFEVRAKGVSTDPIKWLSESISSD